MSRSTLLVDVYVSICRGEDLVNKDKIGTSDPYVEMVASPTEVIDC